MNPIRVLVAVLLRTLGFLAVVVVLLVVIDASDSTDPLGAGLLAFLVLLTIAFAWALVDGVRRGFAVPLVVWGLTAVVAGIAIPVVFDLANDEYDGLSLGDSVFFGLLLLAPAVGGLGLGGLLHRREAPAA